MSASLNPDGLHVPSEDNVAHSTSWLPHPRSLYDTPAGPQPIPMMRGHHPPQPPIPGGYGPPPPQYQGLPPPPPRWGPAKMHASGHWGRGPPPPHPMPPVGYGHPPPPQPGFSGVPRHPPAVHYNQMRMELMQELCNLRSQLSLTQADLKTFEATQQQQTADGELNLAAHLATNQQERDRQIDEVLQNDRLVTLQQQAKSVGLTVEAIEQALSQLIESCTKDNIARGKIWINQRISETSRSADVIGQYLLYRVAAVGAEFTLRLHIVYLINDLIHNLKRKPCAPLQTALDSVVVPIFCLAYQAARSHDPDATRQHRSKLEKVLSLWKSNHLFPNNLLERMGCNCIDQLNSEAGNELSDSDKEARLYKLMEDKINSSASLWRTEECTKHSESVHPIMQHYQSLSSATEMQFGEFVMHMQQEHGRRLQFIAQLESQIKAEEERLAAMDAEEAAKIQQQQPPPPQAPRPLPPSGVKPYAPNSGSSSMLDFCVPPPGFNPNLPPPSMVSEAPSKGGFAVNVPSGPTPLFAPGTGPPVDTQSDDYYGTPAAYRLSQEDKYITTESDSLSSEYDRERRATEGSLTQNETQTTYSHSDPTRVNSEVTDSVEEVPEEAANDSHATPVNDPSIPRLPFWDLPAALMIPLVPLSSFEYHTLKPLNLRLPPPPLKRDEERIKKAIEAFYQAPSHERPRDADGWEKLGLYEFHKNKEAAVKRQSERKRRKRDPHDKPRSHSVDSSHNTEDEKASQENTDNESGDEDREYRFRVTAESWERWREEKRQLQMEALQRSSHGWSELDEDSFGGNNHFEGNFDRRGGFHPGMGGPPGSGMMRPRIGTPGNFRGGNFPPSAMGMMGPGGPRPGSQPPFMPMHPGGRGSMMRGGPPPSLMGSPSGMGGHIPPHPRMPPMIARPPYGGSSDYHQSSYDSGPGQYRGHPDKGGTYGRDERRGEGRGSRFSGAGGGRKSRSRSRSRSHSRSQSRSRSRSRDRQHRRSRSRSRSSRRGTHSRSRSRSRSGYSSRSGSRSRSRSRTSSRSDADRSPPRFTSAGSLLMNERRGYTGGSRGEPHGSLSTEPNYHQRALQIMERIGWNGRGLGSQEQGRLDPIDPYEGGGPRSRHDQYRGVGMMSDAFENFRQRKSDSFIDMLRNKSYQGPPPHDNYYSGGRSSRFPHNRP